MKKSIIFAFRAIFDPHRGFIKVNVFGKVVHYVKSHNFAADFMAKLVIVFEL